MSTQVQFFKSTPEARLPERATWDAFGYDLATVQLETIEPKQTAIIKTGLVLGGTLNVDQARNEGVAMMILPRSSLAIKHRLIVANSPGLIDAAYGGEIGVLVYNLGEAPVTLPAGTRIAQGVFVKVVLPAVHEADAPINSARGGFGSTGA